MGEKANAKNSDENSEIKAEGQKKLKNTVCGRMWNSTTELYPLPRVSLFDIGGTTKML